MPLDGVAGTARADRGAAVQDRARDRRPEPALRGWAPSRRTATASASAGTAAATGRGLPQRLAGVGGREPARAGGAHRVAAVPGPRAGRDRLARAADATATRSATVAGCSSTTGTSQTSTRCGATSCSRSTPTGSPRSRARRTRRSCSSSPSPTGWSRTRSTRSSGRSACSRPPRARTASRAFQGDLRVLGRGDLWAVRYATAGRRALAVRVGRRRSLRRLYPDNPRFQRLSPDDRLIVSEPFSDLPGVWHEIPPATAVTVRPGGVLEERPFRPQATDLAIGAGSAGA